MSANDWARAGLAPSTITNAPPNIVRQAIGRMRLLGLQTWLYPAPCRAPALAASGLLDIVSPPRCRCQPNGPAGTLPIWPRNAVDSASHLSDGQAPTVAATVTGNHRAQVKRSWFGEATEAQRRTRSARGVPAHESRPTAFRR